VAVKKWRGGGAAPVAEVKQVTITAVSVGQTAGVTINGKTVSITATTTNTTTEAAALKAALETSTIPEFAEVFWTTGTNTVTGTHRTPGTPWTAAYFGTATGSLTTPTTATGPNHGDNAANWEGGALPVDGDSFVFELSRVSLLYGLTAFSAFTTNGVTVQVRASFTGTIGLPAVNAGSGSTVVPGGAGGYPEYRPRFLVIGGNAVVTVGDGTGAGCPRFNLQMGTGTTELRVLSTGPEADKQGYAVNWLAPSGNNTLNMTAGSVGLATETGQASAVQAVKQSGGRLGVGAGVTGLATVDQQGGESSLAVAPSTSLTMGRDATSCRYTGAGNLTAFVNGGTLDYRSAGTLTVAADGQTAKVDLSRDPRAKTLANTSTFDDGAILWDPARTWTTGEAVFNEASLKNSRLGPTAKVVRP
jgi:hypothetical protein